ncbi:LON peptidase substrate-binding domain-containing protein, partial [Pseudoalteromonas sp. SIMBA_148]
EQDIFIRSANSQFEGHVKLKNKIPPEVLTSVSGIDAPARLADTMAAHMPLKVPEKQKGLEISSVTERLEYLMSLMEGEID